MTRVISSSGAPLLESFFLPPSARLTRTIVGMELVSSHSSVQSSAFVSQHSIKKSFTFFASTSGDNLVHMVNTSTLTDTQTINPNLTNGKGVAVPAQFLAVKSRPTT